MPRRELPFVSAAELWARPHLRVIDLRAPAEFADDHAPGAVNVPLFENETRAFVGMLYHREGPEAAFREGRAAVRARARDLILGIADAVGETIDTDGLEERVLGMTDGGIERLDGELVPVATGGDVAGNTVVFSCARGGLRSRSVVALVRSLGLERAVGLEGGYKAYRNQVMSVLEHWEPPPIVVSLRGLTGVGKTLLLREIERRRPGWTMDLEGLAGHRSSLLGMVGLEPASQRGFESGLAMRARAGFPDGVMMLEGESRKVGDVVIPRTIWRALTSAMNVRVVAGLARRVRVLSDDYLAEKSARPRLRRQLDAVGARMAGAPDLAGMLDRGETDELVALLLERYYDPLYRRSEKGKQYAFEVEAESIDEAAEAVIAWVASLRR